MMRWIVISLALVVIETAAISFIAFGRPDLLRARVPIHWDMHMQPDDWRSREQAIPYLLIAPSVMLLMLALMIVLPRISPKHFEIDRFAGTFGFLMTCLVAFFGWIGGLLVWVAIEDSPHFAGCFVGGFFVLFAVLGNMMGKVQRNFFVGIRTPWTLASETVWNRTHRQAAWLWVAAGLGGGVAVMFGAPFWIGLIVILVAALWPVVYSLILYKSLEKQGKL